MLRYCNVESAYFIGSFGFPFTDFLGLLRKYVLAHALEQTACSLGAPLRATKVVLHTGHAFSTRGYRFTRPI